MLRRRRTGPRRQHPSLGGPIGRRCGSSGSAVEGSIRRSARRGAASGRSLAAFHFKEFFRPEWPRSLGGPGLARAGATRSRQPPGPDTGVDRLPVRDPEAITCGSSSSGRRARSRPRAAVHSRGLGDRTARPARSRLPDRLSAALRRWPRAGAEPVLRASPRSSCCRGSEERRSRRAHRLSARRRKLAFSSPGGGSRSLARRGRGRPPTRSSRGSSADLRATGDLRLGRGRRRGRRPAAGRRADRSS